jgi:hypothetical protein
VVLGGYIGFACRKVRLRGWFPPTVSVISA